MSEPIILTREGKIAIIEINLPDTRNPISAQPTIDALCDGLEEVSADVSIGAAILTGRGTAFSSGGDLATISHPGGLGGDAPTRTPSQYRLGIQRVPSAFAAFNVPIIAAVNGPAIGAGCDLACMCDIRIAGESAVFAESFVRLGLIPGDGGAWLLPRAVGYSRACEMAFTGDRISATEALDIGLVSRVVPDEALMDTARELAGRIVRNPPEALRLAKRLMIRGQTMRLDELLELSAAYQSIAHTTEEHHEAIDKARGGK